MIRTLHLRPSNFPGTALLACSRKSSLDLSLILWPCIHKKSLMFCLSFLKLQISCSNYKREDVFLCRSKARKRLPQALSVYPKTGRQGFQRRWSWIWWNFVRIVDHLIDLDWHILDAVNLVLSTWSQRNQHTGIFGDADHECDGILSKLIDIDWQIISSVSFDLMVVKDSVWLMMTLITKIRSGHFPLLNQSTHITQLMYLKIPLGSTTYVTWAQTW